MPTYRLIRWLGLPMAGSRLAIQAMVSGPFAEGDFFPAEAHLTPEHVAGILEEDVRRNHNHRNIILHFNHMLNTSPLFGFDPDGSDPMLWSVAQELLDQGVSVDDITDKLVENIGDRLPKAAKLVLDSLKTGAKKMLADRRKLRQGFQKRQTQKWGKSFDSLMILLEASREAGEEYNATFRPIAVEENDLVFESLVRLHARACLIASEVLWLMQGGFASAAMARWRTLHEIAVVSLFIRDKGQETAERYLLHHIIESSNSAQEFQRHFATLGFDPISELELNKFADDCQQLCGKFGEGFRSTWGWAASSLGTKNPRFTDIEKAVSLEHLRPFFKLACYSNHAGGKGIEFDLGTVLVPKSQRVMLAGPSDSGMADPGQCTAISLNQITTNLISHRRITIMAMVFGHALSILTEETVADFIEVDRSLTIRAAQKHRDCKK